MEATLSAIQQELAALGEARLTPTVLDTLDYVVPGEWENLTSLEQIIEHNLGVTDPAEVQRIKARAEAMYGAQPHYARALAVFQAADKVDKVAAAAVLANQVGNTFEVFKILDRFTPKPDTTQAIDAALKLTAELVAFAQLRGIPVTDLAEAKAFPATLATYAKADMMRLAAWLALDGMVPLGPEFLAKVTEIVKQAPLGMLTDNALFHQLGDMLPGDSADEQKGFILTSLDSARDWVGGFIESNGLTQEGLASHLGTVVNVADAGMDVLAATLDASTNYFAHTGVQSVARVLVHDAQQSLAQGVGEPEPVPVSDDPASQPEEGSGSWFKTVATVGAVGAAGAAGMAGIAIGSMLFKSRGDADTEEEGAVEADLEDDDELDDDLEDDELDDLSENELAAREAALQMRARRLRRRERRVEAAEDDATELKRQRRRLRRQRRRRRGGRGRGGGRGGRGGGRGGRGGGRGRR